MRTYKVRTRFTFEGVFFIKAHNRQEAERDVLESCGFTAGGNIHSSLPDYSVNWKFPSHPEKKILKRSSGK